VDEAIKTPECKVGKPIFLKEHISIFRVNRFSIGGSSFLILGAPKLEHAALPRIRKKL